MDLTEYFSRSIEGLVKSALRAAVFKPRALKFIAEFGRAQVKSRQKRVENERNGLHVPPFLIAGIASGCNLFCHGCYARADGAVGHGRAEMSAGRWGALFCEAEELGVSFILLAGGEPLLRMDVLEEAARFPHIIFPVFTNGTLFQRETVRFFDRNRNLIPMISIEGGKKETDSRRGQGVFERTARAMESLKQAGVMFGASVTVTAENSKEVTAPSFASSLRKAGCDILLLVEYVPMGACSEMTAVSDEQRVELTGRIDSLRESQEMMIVSFPGDEKETGGCVAAGRGFIYIETDGRAEPCPFSPYSDKNVSDCTLREALQSGFFTRLKKTGILSLPHDGGCLLHEKDRQVKAILAGENSLKG